MNEEQTPLFRDADLRPAQNEPTRAPAPSERRALSDMPERDRPHLATVSHDGRFWDVYVDFEDDASRPESSRAGLLFSPADGAATGGDSVRTSTILIEDSDEAVVRRAQTFGEHQLAALLRSVL